MFNAATATLHSLEIERASHQGIIAAFGEHAAHPGLVPMKLHRNLMDAFSMRMVSDYYPTETATRKGTEQLLENTREFVQVCETFIKQQPE